MWCKRVFIIKAACIGALTGLVIALSIPREYTSTVKMAPEGMGATQGGSMTELAALAGVDLGQNKSGAEGINLILYPDVVYSTPFVIELSQVPVQSMDHTMTFYDYLDTHVKAPWWSSVLSATMQVVGWGVSLFSDKEVPTDRVINPYALTLEQNEVLADLKSRIAISVDKKTGIITTSATTQDPFIAATIADSLVNKLQEYILTYRTEKAVRDLAFTQNLFNEAQQKYYEAQRRYAVAADANRNIAKQAARVDLDRLQNKQQLTFGVYNQLVQQLEKAKIKVQEQTPCVTIIEPASVPVRKSNTSKMVILLCFIFLGGLAGVGTVLVKELFLKKDNE